MAQEQLLVGIEQLQQRSLGIHRPRCGLRDRYENLPKQRRPFLQLGEAGRRSKNNRAQAFGTKGTADKGGVLAEEELIQNIPKPPKFQPFIAETDTGKLLRAYHHSFQVREGTLYVRPLNKASLNDAATLLTESFAESIGYMQMYRGFLRRQVYEYLTSHLDIAPKAVILEAILIPNELGNESAHMYQEGSDNGASDTISNPTDSAQLPSQDAIQEESAAANEEGRSETSNAATSDASVTGIESNGASHSPETDQGETSSINNRKSSLDSSSDSLYSSFSEEKASFMRENRSMEDSNFDSAFGRNVVHIGDSWQEEDSGKAANGSEVDVEQSSESTDLNLQSQGAIFIGTVELSFTQATREKTLTLNPPQDAAYLCNMAVTEEQQRRGYGSRLLEAAEEVVRIAGFRRVWLHVRIQDDIAARLYERAGFELEKQDCILVSLFDTRRRLLSKFIPRESQDTEQT